MLRIFDAHGPHRQRRTEESAAGSAAPAVVGGAGAAAKALRVELTYTSNAIEGNTLTLRETAEVIEHGITVSGKSLRDHLEAVDHYEAVQWMRGLAAADGPIGEGGRMRVAPAHRPAQPARDRRNLQPAAAPHRRIARHIPEPGKIPQLMEEFGTWLKAAPPDTADGVRGAFSADGNSSLSAMAMGARRGS